jgi:hypothetical protein
VRISPIRRPAKSGLRPHGFFVLALFAAIGIGCDKARPPTAPSAVPSSSTVLQRVGDTGGSGGGGLCVDSEIDCFKETRVDFQLVFANDASVSGFVICSPSAGCVWHVTSSTGQLADASFVFDGLGSQVSFVFTAPQSGNQAFLVQGNLQVQVEYAPDPTCTSGVRVTRLLDGVLPRFGPTTGYLTYCQ